jgi:uncharacterized repeat protein (TIGR01451 family)
MIDHDLAREQRRTMLAAVVLGLGALVLCYALVGRVPTASAQERLDLQITKVLNGSDVVRVGQLLTFTIRITNTGTISVAHLPVIDNFDAGILRLERSAPAYSALDPGGQITWTNTPTATVGGPLRPGQSFEIVTVFRAIAVKEQTVNRARIGEAIAYGGRSRGGGNDSSAGGGVGGRVIFTKGLEPGQQPQVGRPITFTIVITNDSAANITKIPLDDIYKTDYLKFVSAFPAPSSVDTAAGRLRWDDLLPLLGRTFLRPDEAIRITAVFIPLKPFEGSGINQLSPGEVQNEYQKAMPAPKRDDVPIRIISGPGAPTPTAAAPTTAAPTATTRPRRERATETPEEATPEAATPTLPAPTETVSGTLTATAVLSDTSTPAAAAPTETATPTATPTPTVRVPARLPRTGGAAPSYAWTLVLLALLVLAGQQLVARSKK